MELTQSTAAGVVQTQSETSKILDELLVYLNQAKTDCKDWHRDIEHRRKLYSLLHYDKPPKPTETQFADPTYTNVTDLAVGIMLGNRLDWSVKGFTPGDQELHRTSKAEKFLAGAIDINSSRNELNIPYEILLDFVRDGAACIYSVWDPEIANANVGSEEVVDGESESGTTTRTVFYELPLRVQVIDPLKIFPMAGGPKRWARIFRVEEMTVRDVELLYGVKSRAHAALTYQDKCTTKDEFIDAWEFLAQTTVREDGNTTTKYVVRNSVIFAREFIIPPRIMAGYDDLAYTLGFFKPTDSNKASGWGQSILDPLETSVTQLERAVNRRDRQITMYSSLPPVARTQSNRAIQVDPSFGNVIQLNIGEDFGFPVWQGNAPDVQMHMDFLRSRVQQSGFADVMFGSGPSQVSGYAISQLGDQNRIRLTQPIEQLKSMYQRWAQKALHLAAFFAKTSIVRIYGAQRGDPFAEQVIGGELDGFRVWVNISPTFPNEEVRKHAMATQAKGILSQRTIMERYLGIEQPDDEEKRKLQEAAKAHPLMMTYMLISALQEMADEDPPDKAALLTLQKLQEQGLPGMGKTDGGNAPEQMQGVMSPTGEPTPQEQGQPPFGQGPEVGLRPGTPQMTTGQIE